MKKLTLSVILALLAVSSEAQDKLYEDKFPVGDVTLLDGPLKQARDLNMLDSKYRVIKVQPVDMFPHTHHVENVVLLEKRGENKE